MGKKIYEKRRNPEVNNKHPMLPLWKQLRIILGRGTGVVLVYGIWILWGEVFEGTLSELLLVSLFAFITLARLIELILVSDAIPEKPFKTYRIKFSPADFLFELMAGYFILLSLVRHFFMDEQNIQEIFVSALCALFVGLRRYLIRKRNYNKLLVTKNEIIFRHHGLHSVKIDDGLKVEIAEKGIRFSNRGERIEVRIHEFADLSQNNGVHDAVNCKLLVEKPKKHATKKS